jgi:hypothetical protein
MEIDRQNPLPNWEYKDLGKLTGKFSVPAPSHGVVMVTGSPVERGEAHAGR